MVELFITSSCFKGRQSIEAAITSTRHNTLRLHDYYYDDDDYYDCLFLLSGLRGLYSASRPQYGDDTIETTQSWQTVLCSSVHMSLKALGEEGD